MKSSLPKLFVFGILALSCNSGFAGTFSADFASSDSNVFRIAQSDPNHSVSDDCPKITQTNNPYIIHTQDGVDLFSTEKYKNCTQVPYLSISGKDINSLDGLKNIRKITNGEENGGNGLYVGPITQYKKSYSNDSLTQLAGLENITSVKGNVTIANNDNLESINGLNNVENVVGSVVITSNSKLSKAAVFSKLKTISGGLAIGDNPEVTDFGDSFHYLKTIDDKDSGLFLSNGHMPWLGSLTKISGGLYISDTKYRNLEPLGLSSLNYVGRQIGIYDNKNLESIEGLDGVGRLGQTPRKDDKQLIFFRNNPKLKDCSGLSQVYFPDQSSKYQFDEHDPAGCKTTLEGKYTNSN